MWTQILRKLISFLLAWVTRAFACDKTDCRAGMLCYNAASPLGGEIPAIGLMRIKLARLACGA
ncbi:hypothetical protein PanNE5_36590 [Pandoraea sp. NE5]|nr:hypothetical protein PanNE5_36590 [Pandoraea sp. NE5]